MSLLSGKSALVTGASRGLGRGIALALAEQGCNVAINYFRDRTEAEAVQAEAAAFGVDAVTVQADASRADDVDRMFAEVKSAFGGFDILVNNAGTTRAQDIFATSEEDWEFILDTNLKSVFLCCKTGLTLLRDQGRGGRIINIGSVVGQRGALYGHVHYAATKGGICGLTMTLARTAAPFGVTVNMIAPGIIATELLYKTHGEDGVAKLAANVPLGLGTPRDVGLAAAFLAGEGGRYITGASIDVNGGINFRS